METLSVPTGHPATPGNVLITWPDFPTDGDSPASLLTDEGLTLRAAPKLGARTAKEVRRLAAGVVAAIVSTDPFDAEVFSACPTLRVIARVGVGVDSIDLDAATAAGVAVTVTSGANASTTADHAVALMLAAVRRVTELDAAVRRGEWPRTGRHAPWDLAGKTIGLVGFGHIGKLVARRLQGFGVRILIFDPHQPATHEVQAVELDELLRRADIVSIHTPLDEQTHGLIGARELDLMGHQAILVNTARGGIVDERALVSALQSGAVRAAALDVFDTEPPDNQQLFALPNVVLSPHVGGISDQSVTTMLDTAARSVIAVLRGEVPDGLANPDVLNRTRLAASSGHADLPTCSA